MLRLLIFLLWVVFAAFVLTLALSLGQSVKVEAFGWRMDAPAGVAGAALALILAGVALVVSLWKDWTSMRRRSLLRAVLKRREKGVALLIEAVTAHQSGEGGKAEKLSVKAAKLLDRDAVAGLFRAAPAALQTEEPAPEPEPQAMPELEPEPVLIAPPAEEPGPAEPPPPPPPDAGASAPENVGADDAADRDVAAARQVS